MIKTKKEDTEKKISKEKCGYKYKDWNIICQGILSAGVKTCEECPYFIAPKV